MKKWDRKHRYLIMKMIGSASERCRTTVEAEDVGQKEENGLWVHEFMIDGRPYHIVDLEDIEDLIHKYNLACEELAAWQDDYYDTL